MGQGEVRKYKPVSNHEDRIFTHIIGYDRMDNIIHSIGRRVLNIEEEKQTLAAIVKQSPEIKLYRLANLVNKSVFYILERL